MKVKKISIINERQKNIGVKIKNVLNGIVNIKKRQKQFK